MYLAAVAISLKATKPSVAPRSVVESCFNACFAKWLAYKPHLARIRSAPQKRQCALLQGSKTTLAFVVITRALAAAYHLDDVRYVLDAAHDALKVQAVTYRDCQIDEVGAIVLNLGVNGINLRADNVHRIGDLT